MINPPHPHINPEYVGWFLIPGQVAPTHNPCSKNGPCIVCSKPLCFPGQPIKTISVCPLGCGVSYFYRMHTACYNRLTDSEHSDYDSSIVDPIFCPTSEA